MQAGEILSSGRGSRFKLHARRIAGDFHISYRGAGGNGGRSSPAPYPVSGLTPGTSITARSLPTYARLPLWLYLKALVPAGRGSSGRTLFLCISWARNSPCCFATCMATQCQPQPHGSAVQGPYELLILSLYVKAPGLPGRGLSPLATVCVLASSFILAVSSIQQHCVQVSSTSLIETECTVGPDDLSFDHKVEMCSQEMSGQSLH